MCVWGGGGGGRGQFDVLICAIIFTTGGTSDLNAKKTSQIL